MNRTHKVFRGRAPLRLGLAGGGTDVSPYCDTYGGAILNVTIGRYAFATIELLDDPVLQFEAQDLDRSEELLLTAELPLDEGLVLHRAVYNVIVAKFLGGKARAMRISTQVESPMGSGLGSSSALVVAMVEALRETFQLPLGEYDVAHLAFYIEREVAGLAGGRQDQFAATFGGVNYMEFYANDHVIVNPLRIHRRVWNELESSLVLCFTGISRASARIIEDQSKSVGAPGVSPGKASDALEAMHQLKADATEMKNALLMGNIPQMAAILQRSWAAKKRTSSSITSPHLDEMYTCAIDHGALAGKISGAGGGGFMFFFVDPAKRNGVISALNERGCAATGCHMIAEGAQSWRALTPPDMQPTT